MSDQQCDICGGPVPKPRRKYCCDECYKFSTGKRGREYVQAVRRGERVRRPQGPRGLYPAEPKAARQKRACLRCGAEFVSEGRANRICGACRVKNADWLEGKLESYIYLASLWD